MPDEMKIAIVCSSNQNRSMEAHSFLGQAHASVPTHAPPMEISSWFSGLADQFRLLKQERRQAERRWLKSGSTVHKEIYEKEKAKTALVVTQKDTESFGDFRKKGFPVQSFGTGNQVKLPGPSPDKPNVYDFSVTYDEMYRDLWRKDPDLYTQNGILHMLDRNRRIKPKPERFQASKEKFDIVITCEERVYDQVIEDIESREKDLDHVMHLINIDIQDNHEEATIGAFMICEMVTMLYSSDDLDNEVDEILQDFEHKVNRPILHTAVFY